MIEEHIIHSVEQFPNYTDVEHEILPLGPSGPKMSVRSTRLGNVSLHAEAFHGRVRYQESQQGDTIYYGLFLPQGDPIRFLGSSFSKPFVVCWGVERQNEFDYVLEVGTRLYMLEMPSAVCRARGWKLPSATMLLVPQVNAAHFAACAESCFESAQRLGSHEVQTQGQVLMEQFEVLVGDPLFDGAEALSPSVAEISQRKLISDIEAFLRTEAGSMALTGDDLSEAMGVPRRTIYAAFKNQIGVGPSHFQRLVRLYKLRHQLVSTPYEKGVVSKLMLDVGLSHFGRASTMYRSHFGEMPLTTVLRNGKTTP